MCPECVEGFPGLRNSRLKQVNACAGCCGLRAAGAAARKPRASAEGSSKAITECSPDGASNNGGSSCNIARRGARIVLAGAAAVAYFGC